VAGEALRREDFGPALEEVLPFVAAYEERTGDGITYFELTTALAFSWFAAQSVDAAVVEVGLGGRLDATTSWTPRWRWSPRSPWSTPSTWAARRRRSPGRRPPSWGRGGPWSPVTCPLRPGSGGERAAATGSVWLRLGVEFSWPRRRAPWGLAGGPRGVYRPYPDLRLSLLGRHQTANLAVAVAAVEAFFGRALDPAAVAEAAAAARAPAAWKWCGAILS